MDLKNQVILVTGGGDCNPNAVVIVNAGAPVEMPWRNDAAAVMLGWFGGQEFGSAIGDVLTGTREPGGRLPTTWPVRLEDVQVVDVTPINGAVRYDEGIHIGYRAWLKAQREPAYWFGHGLGYTTWQYDAFSVQTQDDENVLASIVVRNTGARPGKHVVQIYASKSSSEVDRPVRWLVGFAAVSCGAGESREVQISIPARHRAYWNGEWKLENGEYELALGSDAASMLRSTTVKAKSCKAKSGGLSAAVFG